MLVPPRASDFLAQAIPGAKLAHLRPRRSHGFNVEQADKFNRAVLDFVSRHALADASRF